MLTGLVGSNRNISERIRTEAITKAVHKGTIHLTGEQYLSGLVLSLSSVLSQRYAFIAQIDKGTSQTLAFYKDGKIADNFSYSLEGSPCENVVAGAICYYPKDVKALFPHDSGLNQMGIESYIGTPIPYGNGEIQGLLVLMHDQAMTDIPLLRRVLEVCVDRVGAEMSRRGTQKNLRKVSNSFASSLSNRWTPA